MRPVRTKLPINIEIAGIKFSISCPKAAIAQNSDPAYQSFQKAEKDPSITNVDVDLDVGFMPDTEGMKKLFDSEESWFICEDDDRFFLSLSHPASRKKTVWTALFDRGMTKVTIYCSESLVTKKGKRLVVSNPFHYPLDQLLLMYVLAQKGGIILHAAGMVMNEKGYLFLGRSGAEKSTLVRLCGFRDDFDFLSDDRIVARKLDDGYRAYGTPWPGEAGIAANRRVSLSAIFFIYHGSENRIREISRKEALEKLLPVISISWYDRKGVEKILDFCDGLVSHVPAIELYFRPDVEVANVLKDFG
jgi:hypothetical protein